MEVFKSTNKMAQVSHFVGRTNFTGNQIRRYETPDLERAGVDLAAEGVHICNMSFDISALLEQWDYQPGQVVVRKFRGKDGLEKIQLRVDLGLLQMNAKGRPDGKRPYGRESLLEYYQEQLEKFRREHASDDKCFRLDAGGLRQAATGGHPVSSPLHLPVPIGGLRRGDPRRGTEPEGVRFRAALRRRGGTGVVVAAIPPAAADDARARQRRHRPQSQPLR